MTETVPCCVNHPDTQTRVRCSACDRPICPRCMRQSAVGQKCPDCARLPRRARGLGKPVHYARGAAAGLGSAVLAGLVLSQVLFTVRFGTLILSSLVGYGVGRAVSWGVQRQTSQPFVVMAAVCGVLAVAVAFVVGAGTPLPGSPFLLLAYVLAGWFAVRGLSG